MADNGKVGNSAGNILVMGSGGRTSQTVPKDNKEEQKISSNPVTNISDSDLDAELENYFGFPLTSDINKFIQEELTNRSKNRNWQNEVTSFIRVIPGAYFKDSKDSRLIFRSVATNMNNLNTEKFSFNQLYTPFKTVYAPDASLRPVSGITGLTIDYKNAWGSMRKAVLKWRASTLSELQEILPYIGTPGRGILIEWGWSPYADLYLKNEKDILDKGDSKKLSSGIHFRENLKVVYGSRGNFDSLLGTIINYEFTLQKDGSFEGFSEILSGGYLMEGMDIGKDFMISSYDPKNKKMLDEKDTSNTASVTVFETLKDAAKSGGIMKMINDDNLSGKFKSVKIGTTPYNKIGFNDRIVKDFGGEPGKNVNDEGTKKYLFVSWGYIEDFIINNYVCKLTDSEGRRLFAFDSRFSKVSSNYDALRSTNPEVCLIPLSNNNKKIETTETEVKQSDGTIVKSQKITSKVDAGAQQISPFTNGEDTSTSVQYSCPRLILVNVEHLLKCIEKGNNLIDFVYDLFNDINNSCNNYWQFQIREMESANLFRKDYKDVTGDDLALSIYSIIDLEFFDKKYEEVKDKLYMMNLMSLETTDTEGNKLFMNSIVKNVNFSSKLSSQMALSVYYALNTDDVEYEVGSDMGLMYSLFAPENQTILDSFQPPVKVKKNKTESSPEAASKKEKEINELRSKYENGINSLPKSIREYLPYNSSNYFPWLGVSQKKQEELYKNLATSVDIMKVALANYKSKSDPANQGIVPVSIELELDGISGIKIGDIFTMDYIPDMYRKRSVFQVSNISHELSSNNWVTKIKAVIRVFSTNVDSTVKDDLAKDTAKPSPTAVKRNYPARVNIAEIPDKYKENWKLVVELLDRIKSDLGVTYTITSGYRDYIPTGGVANSDHMYGCAADVQFHDSSKKYGLNPMYKIWKEIKNRYKSEIRQCFYETTSKGSVWIHIAHKKALDYRKNKQKLFAEYKDHRIVSGTSEYYT